MCKIVIIVVVVVVCFFVRPVHENSHPGESLPDGRNWLGLTIWDTSVSRPPCPPPPRPPLLFLPPPSLLVCIRPAYGIMISS